MINKRVQLFFKPTFYSCTVFRQPRPRLEGAFSYCSQARYQLHYILQNGWRNERQLHCLRFLRSSRQVDCALKNGQLSDLYVLIKIFGRNTRRCLRVVSVLPYNDRIRKFTLKSCVIRHLHVHSRSISLRLMWSM